MGVTPIRRNGKTYHGKDDRETKMFPHNNLTLKYQEIRKRLLNSNAKTFIFAAIVPPKAKMPAAFIAQSTAFFTLWRFKGYLL